MLYERARDARAGTRQQVRAAVRLFLRRHRRDRSYLRWVLRSAAASPALAVALLGLSVAPAAAELPPFAAMIGTANPLAGEDVGLYATPALGDLDGDGDLDADGDLDLVAGERLGGFFYYENTGSATLPVFVGSFGSDDHSLSEPS